MSGEGMSPLAQTIGELCRPRPSHRTTVLSVEGNDVEPGDAMDEMREAVESMEQTRERIATLRKQVDDAEEAKRAADIAHARAKAALAAAQGDTEEAEYQTAYADAQEHGGSERHERFCKLNIRSKARRVLAGWYGLDRVSAEDRAAVAAEVERLRAEQTN